MWQYNRLFFKIELGENLHPLSTRLAT